MYSLISLPILEYLPDKLNIRLFYYLKKNAKTYYSSTNIINSNIRSIVGINLRLPQTNSMVSRITKNTNFPFSLLYNPKKITNSRYRVCDAPKKFIDEFALNLRKSRSRDGKAQLRSRTMQILSLKYYWSNVLNPSISSLLKQKQKTSRDYNTILNNINNIYQGDYINNMDALINSNPLKLHLFSKWRGENGHIEYEKKINRNTRFLQDEMTIKEAILFSNPLLKEILDSQSLIYPYRKSNKPINERLSLFYNKQDNKMTFFNEAIKSISRAGAKNTPFGLGMASIFVVGKLKSINPWQSIVPIKLNTLKKDLFKNELFFKNSTLKNIFNNNLAKLNLILFLVKFKEFISISRSRQNKDKYSLKMKEQERGNFLELSRNRNITKQKLNIIPNIIPATCATRLNLNNSSGVGRTPAKKKMNL